MSATGAPRHVEIVQVLSNTYLMDAENNECKYFREDRRPLARGHYVVVWPGGSRTTSLRSKGLLLWALWRRLNRQAQSRGACGG